MHKSDRSEKKTTILWLLLIYIGSVVIRYILALATKHFPTVYIDEFLYYSLGRSIATEGTLLYLGQPATYNYIIYPLVLSPIYFLFGHGTNYFIVIQLWNIILMSLSVFPFYGLCNAIVQKQKTALWLTALFMLFPCFILGEFIYSEAIIYPMFFTLMYCVYRYLKDNRLKYTIWIGILGALLYYSKPGAVLPAILALLFFAGKAIIKKSGKAGLQVLAGAGCLAICFFALKTIAEKVLGYQGALLSVYDDQASITGNYDNSFFFYSVARYPYYFILAGGIFPLIVSLWRFSEYRVEDKQFYVFLIICSILTMIGSALIINRPERKTILYLRYVEMYLPILLLYVAVPKNAEQLVTDKPQKCALIICYLALVYITVCTTVWGSTTGIGARNESHFLISLASLFTRNVMGIANIMITVISGLSLYLLVRKTEKQTIIKSCFILTALMLMINNIQGYITTGDNTDRKLAYEADKVHQLLGDKEYIHVYADDQSDYGLDVNSRHNISRINERDFLNHIKQNKGIYVPFVPASYRGMTAVNTSPDIDLLIMDEKTYQRVKFSEKTSGFISSDNSFQIIRFYRNDRIIDCILDCKNNSKYTLTVFNDKWLNQPIKIRLEISSKSIQDMGFMGDEHHTIPLSEERSWYEIEITEPVEEYTITVQDDSISFYNFEIVTI